jgi:predicted DNA-binding transcriptional regulator AlpA
MPSDDTRNDERLWTVKDVVDFLSVSDSWVYKRTAAGLLPCVRIGGAPSVRAVSCPGVCWDRVR